MWWALVLLYHGIVCFWWFSSGDRVLGVVALVVGGFLAIGSGGSMDLGVSAGSVFLGGVGLGGVSGQCFQLALKRGGNKCG